MTEPEVDLMAVLVKLPRGSRVVRVMAEDERMRHWYLAIQDVVPWPQPEPAEPEQQEVKVVEWKAGDRVQIVNTLTLDDRTGTIVRREGESYRVNLDGPVHDHRFLSALNMIPLPSPADPAIAAADRRIVEAAMAMRDNDERNGILARVVTLAHAAVWDAVDARRALDLPPAKPDPVGELQKTADRRMHAFGRFKDAEFAVYKAHNTIHAEKAEAAHDAALKAFDDATDAWNAAVEAARAETKP